MSYLEKIKERKNSEEGFTLIELMIVVVIIGILAAIAIPVFSSQQTAAMEASVKSDVKNANTELATALVKKPTADNIHFYTTTLPASIGANDIAVKVGLSEGTALKITGITTSGSPADEASSAKWDNYQIVGMNPSIDDWCYVLKSTTGTVVADDHCDGSVDAAKNIIASGGATTGGNGVPGAGGNPGGNPGGGGEVAAGTVVYKNTFASATINDNEIGTGTIDKCTALATISIRDSGSNGSGTKPENADMSSLFWMQCIELKVNLTPGTYTIDTNYASMLGRSVTQFNFQAPGNAVYTSVKRPTWGSMGVQTFTVTTAGVQTFTFTAHAATYQYMMDDIVITKIS